MLSFVSHGKYSVNIASPAEGVDVTRKCDKTSSTTLCLANTRRMTNTSWLIPLLN